MNYNIIRWFCFSTNYKDKIGVYILFGAFSGVAGNTLSILIRMTLSLPNSNVLETNSHLYNVIGMKAQVGTKICQLPRHFTVCLQFLFTQ